MLTRKRALEKPDEVTYSKKINNYTLFTQTYMSDFREKTGINKIFSKKELPTKERKTILNKISKTMCGEGLQPYLDKTIKRLKNEITNEENSLFMSNLQTVKLDFIVLLDTTENPCGFLVAELGECTEYPNMWTVNLICNDGSICKGGGQTLMGCYMFCIKCSRQMFGLLELAYGYNNVQGYCSYSKFGFIPVPLFKCDMFGDTNLPMIAPTSKISYPQIIKLSKLEPMTEESYPQKRLSICNNKDLNYQKSAIKALNKIWKNESSTNPSKIFDLDAVNNAILNYQNTDFDEIIKSIIDSEDSVSSLSTGVSDSGSKKSRRKKIIKHKTVNNSSKPQKIKKSRRRRKITSKGKSKCKSTIKRKSKIKGKSTIKSKGKSKSKIRIKPRRTSKKIQT